MIKVGDQVIVRESRQGTTGGRPVTMIRFGNVLSFTGDNKEAIVVMASTNPSASRLGGQNGSLRDVQQTRKQIPVSELEAVSSRFSGRKVVQVNPNLRGIGQLIGK